jgi:BirA family biotin operon repressor/biotin-[acetyl-CoA-carboxylase] ligase
MGPTAVPDEIVHALTRAADRLGCFAGSLSWYEEVSSTNDVAAAMAEGAGLYVSLVLRPPRSVLSLITLAAGVAVADGVRAATGLTPRVKWPNDVYVATRKLAGVLSEAGSSSGGLQHVVVGFGINLLAASYPPDVAIRATSIETELNRRPDRGLVLAECLAAFTVQYGSLQCGRTDAVVAAWRQRAADSLGRMVEWDGDGPTRRGRAEDIDDGGALLVRVDESLIRIISGEVRWLS